MTAKQQFLDAMYFSLPRSEYKSYEKAKDNEFVKPTIGDYYNVYGTCHNMALGNLVLRTKDYYARLYINQEAKNIFVSAKTIDDINDLVENIIKPNLNHILNIRGTSATIHNCSWKQWVLYRDNDYKVLIKQ